MTRLWTFFTRNRLRVSVVVICLVSSAMLWAGLFVQLNVEREYIIESKRQENDNLARVFEEHVARTIRAAEVVLREIASEYRRSGTKFNLVQYAKDRSIYLDPYTVLSINDESGDLVLASIPPSRPTNVSKNNSFQYHARNDTSEVFVSAPRVGTTTGKWTVYLSVRINKADGSFGGNSVVGMDPTYFSRIYAELDLGKDSTVTLMGRDGVVRVREGGGAVTAGANLLNTTLFNQHLPAANHGNYVGISPVDQITRIYSYRALKDYPLVVVIGTSQAVALADHDRRRSIYMQAASAMTAVILCFGVFALFLIARSERSNEAQRRSERLFRTLAEGSPVGIFRTDAAGKSVYVNNRWSEIAGMRSETALGDGWVSALHPDDRERVFGEWTAAANNRQPFLSEHRIQRPDGTVTWIVAQARAETDSQGKTLGYIGTTTDITERKCTEEAIRKLNAELEQRVHERTAKLESANKELKSFNYSVSHDLRAPLRGIDGYSQLLLTNYADRLDDEGRRFLQNVRQGAQQMGQLINDLLAYSRLERGDLQMGPVEPQALTESLLADRADEIKTRGVAVSVDLPFSSLHADREGLTMALRNLLENALKFTRDAPQPAIEISGRDTGTTRILAVRDNGVGFDMKFHDRIFDIFQRLYRSEDYPGTGVGLAIVRKAMERMGGRAWAESAPGQGATFYLEIPK